MSRTITFQTDNFVRFLNDSVKRQMPFALANALNATANDMQAGIRNAVTGRGFTIRSETSRQFLRNQIRRNPGEDFARKSRLVARVRIADRGRASLLSLIDQGGERGTQLAIGAATQGNNLPVPARVNPSDKVSRTLYPAKLNLQNVGKSGKALRGDRRTFVVRTKDGETLLLQRRGKRKVRTLFVLERSTRVRARQFFSPLAESVALGRFPENFERSLLQAIRTAR